MTITFDNSVNKSLSNCFPRSVITRYTLFWDQCVYKGLSHMTCRDLAYGWHFNPTTCAINAREDILCMGCDKDYLGSLFGGVVLLYRCGLCKILLMVFLMFVLVNSVLVDFCLFAGCAWCPNSKMVSSMFVSNFKLSFVFRIYKMHFVFTDRTFKKKRFFVIYFWL